MFIQTESTPNPETLKFLPGQQVMKAGTANFLSAADASGSPLAESLFTITGVKGVFLGHDFITVTREPQYSWEVLKPEILAAVMDFYVRGGQAHTATPNASYSEQELDEIEQQIVEIIEHRVRPAVAMDGGDIIFKSFEDGIVKLELHGACSGCPSSSATLKSGIENMLKHYVPEVIAVEAVN